MSAGWRSTSSCGLAAGGGRLGGAAGRRRPAASRGRVRYHAASVTRGVRSSPRSGRRDGGVSRRVNVRRKSPRIPWRLPCCLTTYSRCASLRAAGSSATKAATAERVRQDAQREPAILRCGKAPTACPGASRAAGVFRRRHGPLQNARRPDLQTYRTIKGDRHDRACRCCGRPSC